MRIIERIVNKELRQVNITINPSRITVKVPDEDLLGIEAENWIEEIQRAYDKSHDEPGLQWIKGGLTARGRIRSFSDSTVFLSSFKGYKKLLVHNPNPSI